MRECRLIEAALVRQGFRLAEIRAMTTAEAEAFAELFHPRKKDGKVFVSKRYQRRRMGGRA